MECATYDANAALGLDDIPARAFEVRYLAPAPSVNFAVVMARCAPGVGDPPIGLFVFDQATSLTVAKVYQVLIDPNRDMQASAFAITGSSVTVALRAYTRSDPDCCPSLNYQAMWIWQDGSFTGRPPAVVTPSPLETKVSAPATPVTIGQPAQVSVTATNHGSIPITNLEIDGWNGAGGIPYPTGYWSLAGLAPGRSVTVTATVRASQYTNQYAAPHYGVTFSASGQLPTGRTGTTWTAIHLPIQP
jgi:hypothetical protein